MHCKQKMRYVYFGERVLSGGENSPECDQNTVILVPYWPGAHQRGLGWGLHLEALHGVNQVADAILCSPAGQRPNVQEIRVQVEDFGSTQYFQAGLMWPLCKRPWYTWLLRCVRKASVGEGGGGCRSSHCKWLHTGPTCSTSAMPYRSTPGTASDSEGLALGNSVKGEKWPCANVTLVAMLPRRLAYLS